MANWFCAFFLSLGISAGRRPIWPGDELHHTGTWEHCVHGGAVGQVWAYLSSRGVEHLHCHPQEEPPKPAGMHWCGTYPAGPPPYIHHWQHDCRYCEQHHILYFISFTGRRQIILSLQFNQSLKLKVKRGLCLNKRCCPSSSSDNCVWLTVTASPHHIRTDVLLLSLFFDLNGVKTGSNEGFLFFLYTNLQSLPILWCMTMIAGIVGQSSPVSPTSQYILLPISKLVRINPAVFGSVNFCQPEQCWPEGVVQPSKGDITKQYLDSEK